MNGERGDASEQVGERHVKARALSGGMDDPAQNASDDVEDAEDDEADDDVRETLEKRLAQSRERPPDDVEVEVSGGRRGGRRLLKQK